jgi:hypothetical protein
MTRDGTIVDCGAANGQSLSVEFVERGSDATQVAGPDRLLFAR